METSPMEVKSLSHVNLVSDLLGHDQFGAKRTVLGVTAYHNVIVSTIIPVFMQSLLSTTFYRYYSISILCSFTKNI